MATTAFDLVTPAATLYSGQAEMIVCKTVEGEIAFLADHEPYIGALDPCLVRVVGAEGGTPANSPDGEFRVAVHGGFVEVSDNHVIMLADIAELPDEVDVAAAGTADSGGDDPEAKWAQARLEAAGAAS